ncbi:MAG: phosphoribosylformylglycinamidine synthase subunit PurL [Chloroflexi bacterium]|nr:phosphoribosylformylglycinamidine synthase subunit PurL [Chloroflexota bacterium]MBM3174370.1 phosphoribosylformylglycinamidine synthase subunit PurL [Chloroflexota bacterium]
MPISKEILDEIALSEKEYQLIVERLGREPTEVELGMFGALWSEHCGYKHSKALLKNFPSRSKRVLVKPGEENAGVVDIGDGLVVVMKIESHNHPSAIEPYQGAATGVGGIVRDIFTMGARPIALLNSLRFGPLSDPRNRYLFGGVVGGIAGYGNCLGIPDIGGEVFFADCYSANPLVNALCLGIAEAKHLVKARAYGEGNLLMLVGADTGRDGLHGASGLASRTFEEERELRSTVQVGNPFLEKLLIEACLELAETDWIAGMQDLGAAGLTSSAVESAARGGGGIEIDVLKVPRREKGMTPYEVMLSESQERMLVVVKKGYEDKVKALFDRWELRSDIIGQVTDDGLARIKEGEEVVAEVPVNLLTSPPIYKRRVKKPDWLERLQAFNVSSIPDLPPKRAGSTLLHLLASPNIASKRCVYRQYDHQVGNNTVVLPGNDAGVLRIKGTKKAIALTTDGNARYCYVNPYLGGVIAVAEAARNLACSGAQPLAITNCLNFGNPEKDDVYYQLKECISGMARACRELKIPVISGNVSLYNETKSEAIYPTPVVGMVGLIEDTNKHSTSGFKNEGDRVFLLGDSQTVDSSIGSSEYLSLIHGIIKGNPYVDLGMEKRLQRCCLEAIRRGLINSAHDCSEGGLAVALAESCLANGLGFVSNDWRVEGRLDASLFGEAQSRIVVSVTPRAVWKLEKLAARWQIGAKELGTVGGKRLILKGYIDLSLKQVGKAWWGGLEKLL